jgi:hypothetical protein
VTTVEELLDISGMPHDQGLARLHALIEAGLVDLQ